MTYQTILGKFDSCVTRKWLAPRTDEIALENERTMKT